MARSVARNVRENYPYPTFTPKGTDYNHGARTVAVSTGDGETAQRASTAKNKIPI